MGNPLQLGLVSYNKGAYITIEGKQAGHFYIIRGGRVRIEKELDIPEEEDESILKPGDFFGVVSTMSNHAQIDSAVALDDCTLITVRPDQYSLLIKRNSPVAMKIINGFSRQVRLLDQALTRLTFKSSVEADQRHLFQVGEYYARQNQFNQAYYAYYKYCLSNPGGANVKVAQQRMAKIKPYAKTANLNPETNQFIRSYPKDTMLFAEGESGPELYIIQKGSIRITKIVDDNEVLLALLQAGDIFGEMALLDNKPRSASAIANEDSVLMAVNRANFKGMVVEQPKVISRLTSSLAERIWNLNRQLRNTLIEDPVGRFVRQPGAGTGKIADGPYLAPVPRIWVRPQRSYQHGGPGQGRWTQGHCLPSRKQGFNRGGQQTVLSRYFSGKEVVGILQENGNSSGIAARKIVTERIMPPVPASCNPVISPHYS